MDDRIGIVLQSVKITERLFTVFSPDPSTEKMSSYSLLSIH